MVYCEHKLCHLSSCEQEWFVLSTVLKAFEKFGFKVPAHAITQSKDLLEVMSLCCCLFFTFSIFSPLVGFSWGLKLSEPEFAETLLAGSFGLCVTMHNWALLLAYSHGCTLFFHEMAKNAPPPHPSPHNFSQPGPQSDTKRTRHPYQRGQAWHGLTLNGLVRDAYVFLWKVPKLSSGSFFCFLFFKNCVKCKGF